MKLYVDNREKKLYTLLLAFNFSNQSEILDTNNNNFKDNKKLNNIKNQSDTLVVISKKLELGDLVLCNDNDEILLIFERKSINDLASSVQDGRYKEQSERLNNFNIDNHNIIYIIEGNIDKLYKSKISSDVLKSCVVSLNLNKGFSTLKTSNIDDSAKWILAYCYKISKDTLIQKKLINKKNNNTEQATEQTTEQTTLNETEQTTEQTIDFIDDKIKDNTEEFQPSDNHLNNLSKQAKSKYVTKDNIHILMLSMIPTVSAIIAKTILEEFKTIDNIIIKLREDENCLNNIHINSNNKTRKLAKNVIKKIKEMLL
jgi:ERCC4-type nuclease